MGKLLAALAVFGFCAAVAADVPWAAAAWEWAFGLFWDACLAVGHWVGEQMQQLLAS